MIIVTANYRTKPGKRDQVLALGAPCVAATRKEVGNLGYTLYASAEDPDGILCFERWESPEKLQAHGQQPHYKAFGEARKDLILPESFELHIYAAEQKK